MEDNQDHLNLLREINKKPESSQRELAEELGFFHIDSGSLYRIATYFCIENKIDSNDGNLEVMLENMNIELNNKKINGIKKPNVAGIKQKVTKNIFFNSYLISSTIFSSLEFKYSSLSLIEFLASGLIVLKDKSSNS